MALRPRPINALGAPAHSADLGMDARRLVSRSQVSAIARWRTRKGDLALAAARAVSVRLAHRIALAGAELGRSRIELAVLVAASGNTECCCPYRPLSSVAHTRMSHDAETRTYVERRRSKGKTPQEIRRSLKRYIAG